MREAGHVACTKEMRNAYKILVWTTQGKRPLEKFGWEDNIKTNLKETDCESVDRVHLAQNRVQWWALLNIVKNLWVS
jgi:hypothetical protein